MIRLIKLSARELLGIYQNFIDKRQQKIEDAGVEMEASSSVAYAARMEKAADTMALTDPAKDPTLRAAYDQLSAASKDVLDRMNAGQANITQDEWANLCRELKDAGMITESDFMCTRADLRAVPLGYMDDGGNVVYYDNSPLLSSGLLGTETRLSGYSGLKSLCPWRIGQVTHSNILTNGSNHCAIGGATWQRRRTQTVHGNTETFPILAMILTPARK